jgi:hypothetical protein
MARPLRIEFPGAIYHVTSRGDRRGDGFSFCLLPPNNAMHALANDVRELAPVVSLTSPIPVAVLG